MVLYIPLGAVARAIQTSRDACICETPRARGSLGLPGAAFVRHSAVFGLGSEGRARLRSRRQWPVHNSLAGSDAPGARTRHRSSRIGERSALASLIEDAPKYVKSYAPGPRGETQVFFDRVAVERSIAAAGRSVWDPERPFTLVVLYPPPGRAEGDAARATLEAAAASRGLLISVIPLSIVDANGTEMGRDALLTTAQRYGGDEVLVGRSDAGAPVGQYNGRSIRTSRAKAGAGSWRQESTVR